MTFIFWQNIISPHQFPYIKEIPELSEDYYVILITAEAMTEKRAEMGWEIDHTQNSERLEILIAPSLQQVQEIIEQNKDAHHFFSGLSAYPFIYQAFKYSLNFNIKRYLIAEGPSFYKKPEILHYFKTLIFDKNDFKHIHKVFAIGHHARTWYPKFGFKRQQIIPFSYCINPVEKNLNQKKDKTVTRFVFVGSLIDLKNVQIIIKALCRIKTREFNFDIIGDGPVKENLQTLVQEKDLEEQIHFLGYKSNSEVQSLLNNYDCLILPSKYDGWGAVVNEGLMAGLFCLVSSKCGSADLIIDNFNGKVFNSNNVEDLVNSMMYVINHTDKIRSQKTRIKDWSNCIAPKSIAEYLVNIVSNKKVSAPWKQ